MVNTDLSFKYTFGCMYQYKLVKGMIKACGRALLWCNRLALLNSGCLV